MTTYLELLADTIDYQTPVSLSQMPDHKFHGKDFDSLADDHYLPVWISKDERVYSYTPRSTPETIRCSIQPEPHHADDDYDNEFDYCTQSTAACTDLF